MGSDSQALDEFLNRFEQIFDCPNFAGCVADRLSAREHARSQGTWSNLRHCWQKSAGISRPFCVRLKDYVRNTLVAGMRPKDLADMIGRAIKLDNYQRERHRERVNRLVALCSLSHQRASPPSEASALSPEGEPMQLDSVWLMTSKRHQHFLAGVCLCCGQAGHFCFLLPYTTKKLGSSVHAGVLASVVVLLLSVTGRPSQNTVMGT